MSETATPVKGAGKTRKDLDRAVIRFAGDSGDGMQLTGEQFTTRIRVGRERPRHAAELPGRDPRPGRHAVRRLQLPAPVRQPARLHAGRPSGLPGGDEPGRAQGAPRRPQAGRAAHRQHRRLREAQPRQGRLPAESARRSRAGRALPSAQGRHDRADAPGASPTSSSTRRRRTGPRTSSRSGWCPGSTRVRWSRRSTGSTRSSPRCRRSPRPTPACSRPATPSARRRSSSRSRYTIEPAEMAPGLYRAMTGNRALAWGLLAAAERCKVPVVYGAYPITPASSVLDELAMHKRFRIRTIQAEDEIAAVDVGHRRGLRRRHRRHVLERPRHRAQGRGRSAWRSRPSCRWSSSTSSGPARPPACRPRPSRPTCMQALYGRNSEAPIVGARARHARGTASTSPTRRCGSRIKYMVPVMVLSDGFLANGSEPWLIPDPAHAAADRRAASAPRRKGSSRTCAIPPRWRGRGCVPGTPGLEHRIGGIEKQDVTGNISYDPENHDHMVRTRAEKVRRVGAGDSADLDQRPGHRRRCWWSAGAARTAPSPRRWSARRPRAGRWPRSTCAI